MKKLKEGLQFLDKRIEEIELRIKESLDQSTPEIYIRGDREELKFLKLLKIKTQLEDIIQGKKEDDDCGKTFKN